MLIVETWKAMFLLDIHFVYIPHWPPLLHTMICRSFQYEACFLPSLQWYNWHTVTSFYLDMYEAYVCFLMLCFFKSWRSALDINSLPFFDSNTLILYFACVSSSALDFLNFSKQFPLVFNVYTYTFLKKSWKNITKYLVPLKDVVLMESHKSKCTIYKGLVACFSLSFGKTILYCLLSMHLFNIKDNVRQVICLRCISLNMV